MKAKITLTLIITLLFGIQASFALITNVELDGSTSFYEIYSDRHEVELHDNQGFIIISHFRLLNHRFEFEWIKHANIAETGNLSLDQVIGYVLNESNKAGVNKTKKFAKHELKFQFTFQVTSLFEGGNSKCHKFEEAESVILTKAALKTLKTQEPVRVESLVEIYKKNRDDAVTRIGLVSKYSTTAHLSNRLIIIDLNG